MASTESVSQVNVQVASKVTVQNEKVSQAHLQVAARANWHTDRVSQVHIQVAYRVPRRRWGPAIQSAG